MKKTIFLSLITLAFASPVMAAPFSGPFVGAEIGVDNHKLKGDAAGASFDGLGANGVVGGVYAGYDYSFDQAFIGVEASANLSGSKFSLSDGVDSVDVKAKESYGVSGRVGFKLNNSTGAYVRLGWVNSKFKGYLNGIETGSSTSGAVQYGGGIESFINQTVSLRLEYTMIDYGNVSDVAGLSVNVKNSQIRLGVGYHF